MVLGQRHIVCGNVFGLKVGHCCVRTARLREVVVHQIAGTEDVNAREIVVDRSCGGKPQTLYGRIVKASVQA